MTAPEDQNGLREALAGPALREEVWNCVGGSLEDRSRWVSAIIAGPIARLIAERDAAVVGLAQATANIEKLHSALSGAALVLKARDRAAEAEITRLKEGMEAAVGALEALRPLSDVAAPGDWSVSGVRRRVDEASCVIIDAPSCPVLLALPTGNGVQALEALRDAKLAVAAVNFVRAALATLSPKEHPMAETTSAPSLRELSEAAPKGPWSVRPQEYDDWGVVRGQVGEDGFRPVIFIARCYGDEFEKRAARAEGRQPRQTEAISAFLCRLENDYRAGRLIDPTTLTEAVAAARAEGWQPIETAPVGKPFLAHCIDLVDEYDEDDRLIARAVKTPSLVIAQIDAIFGLMQIPYNGGMPRGRTFTHWMPLPAPPTTPGGRTDG